MAFENATRRRVIPLGTKSKGTANPLSWDLPKVGILAGLILDINGTVAGTLSAPNALGMASIVKRVKLVANQGFDLINISGPGYHYLLRDMLTDFVDAVPNATARNAVTATTFNDSMYLPVALNERDTLGMIMLQNEGTALQLTVEFESDATVATGATVTATVSPYAVLFSVPLAREDWPSFRVAHTIIEESATISGAGDFAYSPPRGQTYVGLYHGCGMAQSPSDAWSRIQVRVNQSEIVGDYTPNALSIEYGLAHGRARLLGTIPVDFGGTSGLGMFGSARDFLYSGAVTDWQNIITATGATTLYTVRRQLVALPG